MDLYDYGENKKYCSKFSSEEPILALVKHYLGTQFEELKNFVDVQQDWSGERPAKLQKNSECLSL